ncbi:MAG: hypothetical protein ACREMO_11905 [Gemmatimonadales bacterium]
MVPSIGLTLSIRPDRESGQRGRAGRPGADTIEDAAPPSPSLAFPVLLLLPGGRAINAAVAAAALLSLVEPLMTGPGGAGPRCRSMAPSRSPCPERYRGGRLCQRFGTLTLAPALEPAIRLAEEGFPVAPWRSQSSR